MRIRSPSLPELHAFIAVMETASFSRAAQQLAVTQGAISRSVLRLESRVGMTLFERSASGVRPTAAAESYYQRIHAPVMALEDAVPQKLDSATLQELRVCAVYSLNMRWLVPRLPLLYAQHPWMRVEFKPYQIKDDFLRDDVDCWLQTRYSASGRWPRHIQAHYILGKEIVLVCHPSVAHRIQRPADVLNFPLLHHVDHPGNWTLWLAAHGVDKQPCVLGDGFDLAIGLIEATSANMGVAVVQRCLIERELAHKTLVIPCGKEVSTGRGYYLCKPKARADSSMLNAFEAWLLQQALR